MQSLHFNQQNKFNNRISDTKQAINEYTNWHLLKTNSFINLNFDNNFLDGYEMVANA